MAAPEVAIVGGGVVGCALAAELARRGISVALLEAERVAAGASRASAGILLAQAELDEGDPTEAFGLWSRSLFPELAARLGGACDLDLGGVVRLAHDEAAAEDLRRRAAWQRARGWEARCATDPAEVRELVPGLGRPPLCVQWTADGQVSPGRLTAALAHEAARHGAVVREGLPVLAVGDGSLETREGRLAAGAVVVAAGVWAGRLLPLPVAPDKGQRVLLRLPGHPLRHPTFGPDCYLAPKPGGHVYVGATHEPEAGLDARVTAGAVADLLRAAVDLVPALAGAEVVEPAAGLRPLSPDGLPLLGRVPGRRATWICAGHHTRGVMWAPATAVAMADALTTGAPLPPLFDPGRFGRAGEATP